VRFREAFKHKVAAFSPMSRLRRVELDSRFFFVTCNPKRGVQPLHDRDFELLANLPSAATVILMRIKIAAYQRMGKGRECAEPIWQSQFYDHILHTRLEFDQALEYMHENPAVKGLVDWKWSSAVWYANRTGPIEIDDVRLPLNPLDRI